MSIMYCEYCGRMYDSDFNCEEHGEGICEDNFLNEDTLKD